MRCATGLVYGLLSFSPQSPTAAHDALAKETLERLATDELLALAREVRRRSEPLLLTAPQAFKNKFVRLLALNDTGAARLLPRGKYVSAVERRGGGAFYSFVERNQSYDRQPDLGLDADYYQTCFYGGTEGVLVDIGVTDIAALKADPAAVIDGVPDDVGKLLWLQHPAAEPGFERKFGDAARALRTETRVPAVEGHSYLLRAVLPEEHDILVAFTFVEQDRYGQLLVWRVLKSWPLAARREPYVPSVQDSRAAPAALVTRLDRIGLDGLIETAARIRDVADRRLLTPRKELAQQQADTLRLPDTGLARLVWPLRYVHVLQAGERGTVYSFATRRNDYDQQPDVELQGVPQHPEGAVTGVTAGAGGKAATPMYRTGFYGGCTGFVVDLGPDPRLLGSLALADEPPAGLDAGTWRILCADDPGAARKAPVQRAGSTALGSSAPARVGHTYLVRAVLPGEHDHLVAFTTLEEDVYGHTILWRVLKSWPTAKR